MRARVSSSVRATFEPDRGISFPLSAAPGMPMMMHLLAAPHSSVWMSYASHPAHFARSFARTHVPTSRSLTRRELQIFVSSENGNQTYGGSCVRMRSRTGSSSAPSSW